jgi:hypothetical protein
MQVEGKTLIFGRTLWVQHGGVDVQARGAQLVVTGRDDDSYLKVFNHFGRVHKLFTFEEGSWVDADTGLPAQGLDESQAGRLPRAPSAARRAPARAKPAARRSGKAARPARKPAPRPAGKAVRPARKTAARPAAKPARPARSPRPARQGAAMAAGKASAKAAKATKSAKAGKPTRRSAARKPARAR